MAWKIFVIVFLILALSVPAYAPTSPANKGAPREPTCK